MPDALVIMFAPFLACLTLVGIHGYFGIHVLKREIIFIDIAMAQIAALGGIVHMLFPPEVTTEWGITAYTQEAFIPYVTYFFSLLFVMIAAAVFTYLKSEKLYISLEALIGITFAVATTGAVILIDVGAGGDVHVHDMLVGSILWVKWSQILKSFIVYSIIGAFHYRFRHKFLSISEDYQKAKEKGINVRLWDFLFYFTLGIVVIHSVAIGGILVVFSFLIIPASISVLFSQNWSTRIMIAWIGGTIVTMLGLYFSWKIDVPSGPSVILFLGVFLFLALIVKALNIFGTSEKNVPGQSASGDVSE